MSVRIEGEPGHGPGWTWQRLTVDGFEVTVQVGHKMNPGDPMGPIIRGDATLVNIIRTLAAAPELLRALMAIVENADKGFSVTTWTGLDGIAGAGTVANVDAARAAIAKATEGRSAPASGEATGGAPWPGDDDEGPEDPALDIEEGDGRTPRERLGLGGGE